jgi:predicted dehydrogenase
MPLFIDKPLCYRKAEGKRFLARARQLGVPVCSFSVLPKQSSFVALSRKTRRLGIIYTVVSTGPFPIRCKWGGIFFYGIHQVDMVLRLAGYEVSQVQLVCGTKKNHVANLFYRNGAVATMNLVGQGETPFHLSVVGARGRVDQYIEFDESMYLAGIRDFVRVFRSGRTRETVQSMLGPVAVLEAMEKSMLRKKKVRVSL